MKLKGFLASEKASARVASSSAMPVRLAMTCSEAKR
jgi:hypothetical protein